MIASEPQFLSWMHREEIQPKTISSVDEYVGQIDLRLACTQLKLTQSQSKKILSDWCKLLPTLDNVRVLFIYSRVPQVLFDAICQMSNLEGLFIKWSGDGIKDFSDLQQLKRLKRLFISSCTCLKDLKDISNLTSLEWLQLCSLNQVSDIEPLKKLVNLKGLIYTGGRLYAGDKIGQVDNLEALKSLTELEYLNLTNLKVKSGNLTPLTYLKKLKYLDISSQYSSKEFARVYAALKNCDHGLGPFMKKVDLCVNCMKVSQFIPWAKGKRAVCKNCSSKRYNLLHEEFYKYVKEFS